MNGSRQWDPIVGHHISVFPLVHNFIDLYTSSKLNEFYKCVKSMTENVNKNQQSDFFLANFENGWIEVHVKNLYTRISDNGFLKFKCGNTLLLLLWMVTCRRDTGSNCWPYHQQCSSNTTNTYESRIKLRFILFYCVVRWQSVNAAVRRCKVRVPGSQTWGNSPLGGITSLAGGMKSVVFKQGRIPP